MSRVCSNLLKLSSAQVIANLDKHMIDLFSAHPELDNLTLEIDTPKMFSCADWMARLEVSGALEKNDMFIVDYDTNFKSKADNIYQSGDEIYTALISLAKAYHKVVIIVSQPKQETWGKQISLNSLSESSRKQQHVDVLIGISPTFEVRNPSNSIGTISVLKSRRGGTGRAFYLREPTGRFSEISRAMYSIASDAVGQLYLEDFRGASSGFYEKLAIPALDLDSGLELDEE